MKKSILAVALLGLVAAPFAADAQTGRSASVSPELLAAVQSTYIFTFGDGVRRDQVRARAEDAVRRVNGRVEFVYSDSIKGFSARMNAVAAERMARQVPDIVAYEQDQVVTTQATAAESLPILSTAPWGTVRVKGQVCGLPYSRVWVIDTGIDLTHPALNIAEAALHFSVYKTAADGNGHGTHVAGTIGAKAIGTAARGVAPGVPVVPVRVLDNSGSGSLSGVIAGVDYVSKQKTKACTTPVSEWCDKREAWVANMSLGSGYSLAVNNAVLAAAKNGIRFAIAAGNSAADAATASPASANDVNIFTVAATDSADVWAYFSNYGSPVDIAAPGVKINSTYKGGVYKTLSGTSMAAPHVAGILTMTPALLSNPSNSPSGTALIVGSVAYTDKAVNRTVTDSYPIAAYQGAAPQTPASGSACVYKQKLK